MNSTGKLMISTGKFRGTAVIPGQKILMISKSEVQVIFSDNLLISNGKCNPKGLYSV